MKIKLFFILPALLFISMFNYSAFAFQDADPFVVVLDAGHGGHDPGNLGNGYLEKNIALNIVLKVGAILEQDKNFKVVYTRKDDTFIDLFVRGEIANKANADLFVSVHCDSHSSDAHGAGTFVLGLHANKQNFEIAKKENSVIYLEDNYESTYANYDINSPESVIGLTIMQEEFLDQSVTLAKIIQDQFTGELKRHDRKVKQAGFIVLHQTFMPSVLVETGFLTNKDEGAFLNSKDGQSKMGRAIADAILKYRKGVVNNSTPEVISKQTIVDNTKDVTEKPKEEIVEKIIPPKKEIISKPIEEVVVLTKKEEKKPVKEVVKSSEGVETIKAEVKKKEVVSKSKPAELIKEKKSKIIFKIQLMASGKNIPLQSENFKGLSDISKEPVRTLFRYMYGNTESYEKVKLMKKNADLKGYKGAFIVAYKDGVRISVTEALK